MQIEYVINWYQNFWNYIISNKRLLVAIQNTSVLHFIIKSTGHKCYYHQGLQDSFINIYFAASAQADLRTIRQ